MTKIALTKTADDACPDPDEGRHVTQSGDCWHLGDHILVCGDARDRAAYTSLMGGDKAIFCITDPPYNVRVSDIGGLGFIQHREFAMASGEMSQADYAAFLSQCFQQIRVNTIAGALCTAFIDWRHLTEMLIAGEKSFVEQINLCVWVKANGGMGSFYRSRHELAFIWKCNSGKHLNNIELGRHGRYRTNVWEYAGVNSFKPERPKSWQAIRPSNRSP